MAKIDPFKIGKNLKNIIKMSNYKTQENFANAFGCDPTTVRRWIHKGINSIATINQISDFFDIDAFRLLE